jgi:type II secretory pathway pseudopilin PulG
MKRILNKGFSLIELSVLLLVFAGLAVVAVQNYSEGSKVENLQTVTDKLKIIKRAILNYAANQGYYPCPADPTQTSNNANYAKGARDSSGNCTTTGLLTYADPTVDRTNLHALYSIPTYDYVMGTVPCEDIGLPKDCMISPSGNKYGYTTSTHLSRINPCISFVSSTANSTVTIPYKFKMLKNFTTTQTLTQNYAVAANKIYSSTSLEPEFLLIYFGEDGIGSWTKEGSRATSVSVSSGSYISDNLYQQVNHNINTSKQTDEYFLNPEKPLDNPNANLSATNQPIVFGDVLVYGQATTTEVQRKVCLRCRNCSLSHQDIVVRLDSFTNCVTSPMPTVCQ